MHNRNLKHFGMTLDQTEDVSLLTLDEFCRMEPLQRIHFLKLDVEGHELKLLQGAHELLERGGIDFHSVRVWWMQYRFEDVFPARGPGPKPCTSGHVPGRRCCWMGSNGNAIVALVCSSPPPGRARRTVSLLADEAVKRKLVPRVGWETRPRLAGKPQPEAVAGKKCGAWRNWMREAFGSQPAI